MMSNKQIASAYNGFASRLGERAAYELFMDKFPDYEGELNQLVRGCLDLTIELPADDITDAAVIEASEEDDDLDVTGLGAALDDGFDDEYIPVPVRSVRVKAEPTAPVAKPANKVVIVTAAKGESKADRAMAIYQAAADKSRKAMIDQFIHQLAMTPAGAATYLQNIKKKLGT